MISATIRAQSKQDRIKFPNIHSRILEIVIQYLHFKVSKTPSLPHSHLALKPRKRQPSSLPHRPSHCLRCSQGRHLPRMLTDIIYPINKTNLPPFIFFIFLANLQKIG